MREDRSNSGWRLYNDARRDEEQQTACAAADNDQQAGKNVASPSAGRMVECLRAP